MQFTSNVVIIGGGLNGYLLAYILSKANLSVTVIEEKHSEVGLRGFDGRAYALAESSVNVLKALDIWQKVKGEAQEIKKMLISKATKKNPKNLASLEFNKSNLDGESIAFMVEDRFLLFFLEDALKSTHTTVIKGAKAVNFQKVRNKMEILLNNGNKINSDLLVAADGKKSQVAKTLGLSKSGWKYDQKALVCAVCHEKTHNGIAHQTFYPDGPFAILPLKGNRSSLVWTERSNTADEIMALSDKKYLNCLKEKFGDFLGEVNVIGQKHAFELDLGVSERIIDDRLALVGDSAQNIHPLAGQGLNLGIRDVACLAEVLIEGFRLGEDIGSFQVLKRYERWRRLDSTILFATTDSINRFFSVENRLSDLTNFLSMKFLDKSPVFKKFLIKEAIGLNGDLPKLLQGLML